jgi:hypothetical protein
MKRMFSALIAILISCCSLAAQNPPPTVEGPISTPSVTLTPQSQIPCVSNVTITPTFQGNNQFAYWFIVHLGGVVSIPCGPFVVYNAPSTIGTVGSIVYADNIVWTPVGTGATYDIIRALPTSGTPSGSSFFSVATGLTASIFLDNVAVASPYTVSTSASQIPITLTNVNSSSGGGSGSVPGVVTTTQLPSGLMALYNMTEGSGTTINDTSGNGRNGTFGCTTGIGNPTWVSSTLGGLSFGGAACVTLPASLNSALTIVAYINFSCCSAAQTPFVVGSGSPAIALASTQYDNTNVSQQANGITRMGTWSNGSWSEQAEFVFQGTGTLGFAMDTVDRIYINGIEPPCPGASCNSNNQMVFTANRASAGLQTAGSYQIGCTNTGQGAGQFSSCGTFKIYKLAFFSGVLTPSQMASVHGVFANSEASSGVPLVAVGGPSGLLVNQGYSVHLGDSQTLGSGTGGSGGGGFANPYTSFLFFTPGQLVNVVNQGIIGELISDMRQGAPYSVDPILSLVGGDREHIVLWGGTNNGTGQNVVNAEYATICRERKVIGAKCFVVTMVSRTGEDTFKDQLDPVLRAGWPYYADGLVDIAALQGLGADGAFASTTYFATDEIHPSGLSNTYIGWMVSRSINRFYGNNDFSTANIYTSAAPAAVTVSAATESSFTATFTTTANTFSVGNLATVTGVTPAGYNGTWVILTAPNNTTFTAILATSGLGSLTVSGTATSPQVQHVDRYSIVNFGAGNFTIDSCIGYTGQNIYIRNINATASTLVPMATSSNWTAETITGAGASPTTLAANTTAILQSQLVGTTTGGCNWVRIQ